MKERNVVSWTAMINGCVTNGSYELSIDLFRKMRFEGVEANHATIVAILPACGELGALKLGKEIHGFILRVGLEFESKVIGTLIAMYSKCDGAVRLALLVFERAKERDTITWTSMIQATSQIKDSVGTFRLFDRMKRDGRAKLNSVTMLTVIDACAGLGFLEQGLAVFCYVVKSGFLPDIIVGNSLINMFAKCGCLQSSCGVFTDMMHEKDIISYSTMIQSYGLHGCGHDALKLFQKMQKLGFRCDDITLLAILSACNHSGLIEEGNKIFDCMKRDFQDGLSVEHYACYVDLLGRGGKIEAACEIVRKMPTEKNSNILSSLISTCRIHNT